MPPLSIITINLNNAKGLEKTIKSVIGQTYKDFEYIVIDGGSEDESVNIINNHADFINYYISEKDNGIYNAMNKGARKAIGDYLCFLNSGDFFLENTILENILIKNPVEDILYGDIQTSSDGKIVRGSAVPDEITLQYMIYSTIMHPAAFIKRDLFIKVGGYNEKLIIAADYEFFLKAIFTLKATYRNLNMIISFFDEGGVSKQTNISNDERTSIQLAFFGKDLINLANAYISLQKEYKALLKNKFVKLALKVDKLINLNARKTN